MSSSAFTLAALVLVVAVLHSASSASLQVGNYFPGGIRIGTESSTCAGTADEGRLRRTTDAGVFCVDICNSTAWLRLACGESAYLAAESLQGLEERTARIEQAVLCSGDAPYDYENEACLCGPGEHDAGGSCAAVPPGYYSPANSASLLPCVLHTYSTGSAETCSPCPANSVTLAIASASISSCLCGGGLVLSGSACVSSPSNTYSAPQSNTAVACPANSFSSAGSSSQLDCTCGSGYTDVDGDANGRSCTNVDECASQTHNCASNEVCFDNVGSFTCTENIALSAFGASATASSCITTCSSTAGLNAQANVIRDPADRVPYLSNQEAMFIFSDNRDFDQTVWVDLGSLRSGIRRIQVETNYFERPIWDFIQVAVSADGNSYTQSHTFGVEGDGIRDIFDQFYNWDVNFGSAYRYVRVRCGSGNPTSPVGSRVRQIRVFA